MRWIGATAAVGLVMALGCAGMMGYGTEQNSIAVQSSTPFTLNYKAADGEPHNLWLDYSVTYLGSDFLVSGPIDAATGGSSVGTWSMNLTKNGTPVSGGRFVMNSSESTLNGQGNARATIFLVELPAQPAGTAVTVSGTFTPAAGTTVNTLRLVVTD